MMGLDGVSVISWQDDHMGGYVVKGHMCACVGVYVWQEGMVMKECI